MLKKISIIFVFAIISCSSNKNSKIVSPSDNKHMEGPYFKKWSPSVVSRIDSSNNTDDSPLNTEQGDRVYFDYDSSSLNANSLRALDDQVAWLSKNIDTEVIIEGHCDERGTREYNLALGEKRASAVKNYLVNSGVNSSRITVISYGKERPAALGSNESAWSKNRRAVTVINID